MLSISVLDRTPAGPYGLRRAANDLRLRLHLGCGEVYLRGYVNIDAVGDLATDHPHLAEAKATVLENYFKQPYRKHVLGHDKRGRNVVDLRAEVHDLSMFADRSVDEILVVI